MCGCINYCVIFILDFVFCVFRFWICVGLMFLYVKRDNLFMFIFDL